MGTTVYPSQKARQETSWPSSRSSITTWSPADPNSEFNMIDSRPLIASCLVSGRMTPFPAAKPDAYYIKFVGCGY